MNKKARIKFSNAVHINTGEVYLDQVYPNLGPDAEEYMEEVIKEFEYQKQREVRERAGLQVNSATGRSERAQEGRYAQDLYYAETSNLRKVKEGVEAIIKERAQNGERIPAGLDPELDAAIAAAQQEKLAGIQAKQDKDRMGAIINAAIDEKVEERMKRDGVGKAEAKGALRQEGVIPGKKDNREDWYRREVLGEEQITQEQDREQQQEKAQKPVLEMA